MTLQLKYLAFVVADLERSLHFYRTLGLPIPGGAHRTTEGQPEDHAEISVDGLRVAWETEALTRQVHPAWTPPAGGARLSVAFEAHTPAEVDAATARMAAAGFTVKAAPYDASWGQRYATLQDPDGNGVDVFAWLEGREN